MSKSTKHNLFYVSVFVTEKYLEQYDNACNVSRLRCV